MVSVPSQRLRELTVLIWRSNFCKPRTLFTVTYTDSIDIKTLSNKLSVANS